MQSYPSNFLSFQQRYGSRFGRFRLAVANLIDTLEMGPDGLLRLCCLRAPITAGRASLSIFCRSCGKMSLTAPAVPHPLPNLRTIEYRLKPRKTQHMHR